MIPVDVIAGLFSLTFVAMVTPGPNNVVAISLASAADADKTVRACGGMIAGSVGLLTVTWLGLGSIMTGYPVLRIGMVAVGSAYLAWCGFVLLSTAIRKDAATTAKLPASFWALAALQFTNPKAWMLCILAASAMQLHDDGPVGLAGLAVIFTAASAVSLAIWVAAGRLLGRRGKAGHTPKALTALLGLALIGTSAFLGLSAI